MRIKNYSDSLVDSIPKFTGVGIFYYENSSICGTDKLTKINISCK